MIAFFDLLINILSFTVFDTITDASTYTVQEVLAVGVVAFFLWLVVFNIIKWVVSYAGFDI